MLWPRGLKYVLEWCDNWLCHQPARVRVQYTHQTILTCNLLDIFVFSLCTLACRTLLTNIASNNWSFVEKSVAIEYNLHGNHHMIHLLMSCRLYSLPMSLWGRLSFTPRTWSCTYTGRLYCRSEEGERMRGGGTGGGERRAESNCKHPLMKFM